MKNQWKLNEEKRPLNSDEKQVLAEVQEKTRITIDVIAVSYERHTPRATLCIAYLGGLGCGLIGTLMGRSFHGITFRSKSDVEDPGFGKLMAFRRALEDYADKKKHFSIL